MSPQTAHCCPSSLNGDLASHLPCGGLRLPGQQERQAEGEKRGRTGKEGGRGSKNF